MNLGWYGVVVLLQALLATCRFLRKGNDNSFQEVKQWLVDNGATVDDGMQSDLFEHGGSKVRGILENQQIADGKTLFRIPKKLWLVLSHFPEFSEAQLPLSCRKDVKGNDLKFAAALASEAQKGSKSFYYTYLKHLPTLDNLKTFLPRLMTAKLRSEFAGLPLVAEIEADQERDGATRKCFEDWVNSDKCPAKHLPWEQVLLALMWIQTRSFYLFAYYNSPDSTALLPGADLLNTAAGFNTDWSSTETEFDMRAQGKSVSSGAELHDLYCDTCDNDKLLRQWGVFLEDNPKPDIFTTRTQQLRTCSEKGNLHLKQMTESALQDPASMKSGWRSPRCRQDIFSMEQGPLRCSLARLSWEICADVYACWLKTLHRTDYRDTASPHWICQLCSSSYNDNQKCCLTCGCKDIFNMAEWSENQFHDSEDDENTLGDDYEHIGFICEMCEATHERRLSKCLQCGHDSFSGL